MKEDCRYINVSYRIKAIDKIEKKIFIYLNY